MGDGLRCAPANRFHYNFSNACTPQNRDSHESAAVGCAQLLFEPVAIRLNGFHTYLQLCSNFRGCFAVTKQPKNLGLAAATGFY
jgi:hypothetical protein